MHHRATVANVFVLVLGVAHALGAQHRTKASVNGVWRSAGTRVERPDSTLTRPPLTGLRIVYNGHFSQVFVASPAPGVQQASRPTTAEQKAARYDVVTANAGSFEMTDSTFVVHFEVAKGPATMGTSVTTRYRVLADTLWETATTVWAPDTTKRVRSTTKWIRQK